MQEYTPKILKRTEFGNPILRSKTKRLSKKEVLSKDIQHLIADMKYTCDKRKYGVGLAATQVGVGVAVSVIAIKTAPSRLEVIPFDRVIINPEILDHKGRQVGMWEGCISFSSLNAPVFAKAVRWPEVKVSYLDDNGKKHEEWLSGLAAHVFQHETDHCNGVLFVDRVKDSSTWMNASEYKKMRKSQRELGSKK